MKRKLKRFVPKGTRKALAEIEALAEHRQDYGPSIQEVVCTWAASEMSEYLEDFLRNTQMAAGRRTFIKWLRQEPARIELIMKAAVLKFEGPDGRTAAFFRK